LTKVKHTEYVNVSEEDIETDGFGSQECVVIDTYPSNGGMCHSFLVEALNCAA